MTTQRRRLGSRIAALALCTVAFASCGGGDRDGAAGRMRVTSTAFDDGEAIPERFSCEGDNVSPPLAWSDVPEGAAEIAVVVSDPDAPEGPFFHWLLLGVAPSVRRLAAGEVPPGAVQSPGSSENPTYIGMCPPTGEEHGYEFRVHALRDPLAGDAAGLPPAEVDRLVRERSISSGTLKGRYGT